MILANVNELYQQYGGGVKKHINGIRNFAFDMYESSTNKPQALFLLEKESGEANIETSIGISSGDGTRNNPLKLLMPSFGQPSSDVCITSNPLFRIQQIHTFDSNRKNCC